MNISRQIITNFDKTGYIKKKQDVSKDSLSQNYNKNYTTPLERTTNSISFKGVPSLLIRKTKPMPFKKAMDAIRSAVGDTADTLWSHIQKSETMSQRIIIDKAKDTIQIKEKTPIYLVIEGIKYPFTKLPFHLMDWALKGLKKVSAFKSGIEKFQKKDFYQKFKATAKDDDKINALRGILETANKYKYDSEKIRNSSIIMDATKMFDPKTGNYNSVHERALTRIVTGFIPAFFLANDAYNLSRLMDDDKKSADKEKKLRFNQETKRVLSNAYIQLITLGALSKYINKSKFAIVATTFLTVLATESYSRLSNGKRIHFLSSEEAKKINEKTKQKSGSVTSATENNAPEQVETKQKENPALSFKNNIINTPASNDVTASAAFSKGLFKDFALVSNLKPIEQKGNKDEKKPEKELKPLLSFGTIMKASAAIVAAGFALKGLKAVKVNGKRPVADLFRGISNKYNSIYKSLTEKEHTIKKTEFDALLNKIKINGFSEIANEYRSIAQKYQKKTAIDKFQKDFIKDLEKAGIAGAKDFGKIDKKQLMTVAANDFITHLKNCNQDELAKFVKETLFGSDGKIIDFNNKKTVNTAYTKIFKKIKELKADEHMRPLDNSFKINQGDNIIEQFEANIEKLKNAGKTDVAQKYEKLINDALNAAEVKLGKTNKFFKPAVDFFITPFKFLWGTVTLPYRVVKMVLKLKTPMTAPSHTDRIKSLSNSVLKLNKKINQDNTGFRKDFEENILKSFNKLSMSSVSNSDLSNLAKLSATAATIGFLVTDNYNMVMLKSNGDDKKQAQIKAKERVVQETSRLFYQMLFIDLFNSTFSSTYHNSLLGAQAVNTVSTLAGEYFNRTAIGMPVKEKTRDQILNKEYENITSPGLKGKFFRFMTRLTGKKVLSQRDTAPAKQKEEIKK